VLLRHQILQLKMDLHVGEPGDWICHQNSGRRRALLLLCSMLVLNRLRVQ
jgi:hypothetical protein